MVKIKHYFATKWEDKNEIGCYSLAKILAKHFGINLELHEIFISKVKLCICYRN